MLLSGGEWAAPPALGDGAYPRLCCPAAEGSQLASCQLPAGLPGRSPHHSPGRAPGLENNPAIQRRRRCMSVLPLRAVPRSSARACLQRHLPGRHKARPLQHNHPQAGARKVGRRNAAAGAAAHNDNIALHRDLQRANQWLFSSARFHSFATTTTSHSTASCREPGGLNTRGGQGARTGGRGSGQQGQCPCRLAVAAPRRAGVAAGMADAATGTQRCSDGRCGACPCAPASRRWALPGLAACQCAALQA